MSTEDYTWALVAKRLAKVATEIELQQSDELLKKYSDTDRRVKVIADWWRGHIHEEIARRGAVIFEKVKEKIKAKKD